MDKNVRNLLLLLSLLVLTTTPCLAQVCGCTDPLASNYDANATVNDGSCLYDSTTIDAFLIGNLDSIIDGSSTLFYWENGYWTFNDHFDSCLYQLDSSNANLSNTICINGINCTDMEEISQDSLYLYFGDIGNNNGDRQDLHILRISKESILNQTFEVDTIRFSYEDQTDFTEHVCATDYDCEAFIVTEDSLYLFTKQWLSSQTTLYSLPKTPGTHLAHQLGTYNTNGLITGATYLPQYQLAVLCGYDYDNDNIGTVLHPFIILLYDFQGNHFFSGNKRRLDFDPLAKAQMEAIATYNALDYYITSEHFTTTFMGFVINLPSQLQRLDLRDYLSLYLSEFGVTVDTNDAFVAQSEWNDIRIYPNPAYDQLYIDYPQAFQYATYEIVNLNGQKKAAGILKDNHIPLPNTLQAGEYLLILRNGRQVKTVPFIKNRK